MNNASFIPYQRLELKKMSTEQIISIIRIAAKNYDDTSLILTPRIDQSGQAYYWTGLRYGECTEQDFKLCLNREIESFILCFLMKGKDGLVDVGVKDNGEVCGVQDAKKLMEDIPNKVRDMMGILVEVNLKEKDGKQYLEIVTEAYPYPVSFRGKYYQRSGATNQELKGAALDRFMLRKQGKTWDGVPVPYLKAEDLDNATFDLFRKYAKRSGRMEEADLMDDNHGLLEKLRLYEGSYLKRAAALLFHPAPEKYVTGAFVKVGFFREGMDLVYQDEVHGNLFQQIVELLSYRFEVLAKPCTSKNNTPHSNRYEVSQGIRNPYRLV